MEKRTYEKNPSLLDDMVETWLADWSSLRHYLRQRRIGRPADATLDTLLAEVLRTKLPRSADVRGAVRYLVSRPH
ncbi:MAG: hypothetical protein AB7U81_07530 [Thiohalomonadaceae bacterium]